MSGETWAIVLAGGQGSRLRPLTRRVCGDERPKQFAPLVGSRSMLHATLDGVALAMDRTHTVVVAHRDHVAYFADEMGQGLLPRVLVQPADRGTAAAILLAAHWISWRDPDATLALFPSDHFIENEAAFMDHVQGVAAFVREQPAWMVLLGAAPTEPELEYGWIAPGPMVGRVGGDLIHGVVRFVEKPTSDEARACLSAGGLWNTLVLVARAATLLAAGWQALPALSERLAGIEPFVDSEDEPWALQQAYEFGPKVNFSRAVLDPGPSCLAGSRIPASVVWSDWGTPERVVRTLRRSTIAPPWLPEAERLAAASA